MTNLRLRPVAGTLLLLTMASCKPSTETKAPSQTEARAPIDTSQAHIDAVHNKALVLDSHVDLELELIAEDMDPWSSGESRVNLDKMQDGGMDGAFLIVFSPQGEDTEMGISEALQIAETRYKAIKRLTEKHSDRIELALSAADARRIHDSGKRIAFIGMENAYPLGQSIAALPDWVNRGVRYVGITHVGHNQFGDSSNPSYARGETERKYGGLSPLGKELVKALNAAGVMVDVSHASKDTMMQAAALSKAPIIASHSSVKALVDNPRNLDDEQLRTLAKNGGVIHIVAYPGYIKNLTPEQEARKADIRKEMGLEDDYAFMAMDSDTEDAFDEKMKPVMALADPANVSDLVDHIDYVVKLIGVDHVGISSDFDGGGKIDGWMNASETENVTAELVRRGYSQEDIDKIWGGNLLRVFEAVQTYAETH